MNQGPFVYPRSKHRRSERPPVYVAYASYRPFLRREFYQQCVYCRMTDTLIRPPGFCVEHYRPKSKFPHLECDYQNLFYACHACNARKGHFWPTASEQSAGHFIPNPCDHVMARHVQYAGTDIVPKTKTGKFIIELLDLNDDATRAYRESYLTIIEALTIGVKHKRTLLRELKDTYKCHPTTSLSEDIVIVETALHRMEQQRAALKA